MAAGRHLGKLRAVSLRQHGFLVVFCFILRIPRSEPFLYKLAFTLLLFLTASVIQLLFLDLLLGSFVKGMNCSKAN